MPMKILREDGEHFVLHGNNGEFKVHHSKFSPGQVERMRKSIQALADGGAVNDPPSNAPPPPPDDPSFPQHFANPDALANPEEPGFFQRFDTIVSQQQADDQARIQRDNAASAESLGELPQMLMRDQPKPYDPRAAEIARKAAVPAAPADEMYSRPPEQQPNGGPSATSTSQTSLSFPKMPPPPDFRKAEGAMDAGIAQGNTGANDLAKAQADKSNNLIPIYEQANADLKTLNDKYQSDVQGAQSQIDRQIQDIASTKIDPNHFWSERSVGQKVAAGLGMILSGIGSGLTGQPNMAAQFLQRSVDRDIDAQKANLGKKENLVGYYFKKLGNIHDAATMARSVLTATLAGQVSLEGARAGGPEAMANAELLKSQLASAAFAPRMQMIQAKNQDAWQRYQMSFQQRLLSQFGQNAPDPGYVPSGTPPPIPSELSLKGVSDLGKAKGEMRVNLPELGPNGHTYAPPEVARDVNKILPDFHTMDQQISTMENLGKKHAWTINAPWPTDDKEAYRVAANALNLSMNRLMQQQRFTEEEQKLYKPMIANPYKFLLGDVGESNLQSMRQLVTQHRAAEYARIGLNVPGRPPEKPIGAGAR